MNLRSLFAFAAIGSSFLLPAVARAGAVPTIAAVHFSQIGQNLRIEVDGSGFGSSPLTLPAVGWIGPFRITDVSQGGWNAGNGWPGGHDPVQLQYTSWTDGRIVVDGFGAGYGGDRKVVPGDSVAISVTSTAPGGLSTKWTGNLTAEPPPALNPGGPTPQVAAVHFSQIGQNLHIEVEGAGFGSAPLTLPAVGWIGLFRITDITRGGWTAGNGWPGGHDPVQLQYTSWTDSRIVVDGFGAGYGGDRTVQPGDSVSIYVQHSGGPEYTVWNGTLQGGPVPALNAGGPTPQVAAVTFGQIGQNLRIEVVGAGFGAAPLTLPAAGWIGQFRITDVSQGGWTAGNGWPGGHDPVQLQYASWTDTRIVVDGFGPGYGGQRSVSPGDNVSIYVQHAGGPEYVVWNGTLAPGKQPTASQLLLPAPDAVVKAGPLHFGWTPVAGAAAYYLQAYLVQTAPGSSVAPAATMNVAWQGVAPQTSVDAASLSKGTYRWRVAAINGAGELILPGWTNEGVFSLR
jgi:hypothetical protein